MERIHAYLLEHIAASTGDVAHIGPFVARVHVNDPNRYRNYAVPALGARPTAKDVATLCAFYRERERIPRLEYLPDAAPAVEPVLLENGFCEEQRLALMVFSGGADGVAAPTGVRVEAPSTQDDCLATLAAQHAAYGEGPPSRAQVADFVASMARGTRVLAARSQETGEVVGAGLCTVPCSGVTELAAIGVIESHRGRGIATALAAALARAASADVSLVFLMPAHDEGRRVYERAGFMPIPAQILHISRASR